MPTGVGPSTIAMAVAATLAVLPFVVIAAVNLLIVRRGWTPLTQLVEHYMRRYPWFAAAICAFVGALAGHVFWSFGDNPALPPAPGQLLPIAVGVAIGAGILGAMALGAVASVLSWVRGRL